MKRLRDLEQGVVSIDKAQDLGSERDPAHYVRTESEYIVGAKKWPHSCNVHFSLILQGLCALNYYKK